MVERPDIAAQGSVCVRSNATAAIVRLTPHWREYLQGDLRRMRHEGIVIKFVPEWPEY